MAAPEPAQYADDVRVPRALLRRAYLMLEVVWKGDDVLQLDEVQHVAEQLRALLIDGEAT